MTRRLYITGILALLTIVSLVNAGPSAAGPDLYQGDTAIYTGASTHNMPDVLLLIDNSHSTLNTASGQSYDNTHNYYAQCVAAVGAANCYSTFGIYTYNAGQNQYTGPIISTPTPTTGGTLNTSTVLGSLTSPALICMPTGTVGVSLLGIVGQPASGGTYQGSATAGSPNLKQRLNPSPASVVCDYSGQGASYALGNFLNYSKVPPPALLVQGSDGNTYKLILSHISSCPSTTNPDDQPVTGAVWSTYWQLYTASSSTTPWLPCTPYDLGSLSQQKIIYDAVNTVVNGARFSVKFGAMVYGSNNSGGRLIDPIRDISADTDFNAFMNTLPKSSADVLSSNTARPQAEALYNAYDYFKGASGPTRFASGSFSSVFTSYYCEKLFVILVTNGLPNGEDANGLASAVGDYNHDGREPTAQAAAYGQGTHYLDDVALMMYNAGVPALDANNAPVTQRIRTNVVLAFQADDPLLKKTADEGQGSYFVVNNAQQLAVALNAILSSIVLETDTSFVAPVVPVSPQSKVYTGSRVYMGFFKPKESQYWYGNIKKYAIDDSGNILDQNGNYSNYVDENFDGFDDRDNAVLPQGMENGSFRSSSKSYWFVSKPTTTETADAGSVDAGGAGAVLLNRQYSITSPTSAITGTNQRKIYTYLGTADLTNSNNKFAVGNGNITAATLGLPGAIITSGTTTDVNQLINFVSGFDVYDENSNGNFTEKRAWIFGDVLHSKPFVVSYATYTFNDTNEADCSINKSMIFAGTNDGMLHAINDCDGSEAWAFIPPDVRPYLQYLTGGTHAYFADSTIYSYIFDQNQNGTIEAGSGDKVFLLFGLGRGTGLDSAPTTGFYYILDVSYPGTPKYVGKISNATSGFSNLGEAWSEPKIVKAKLGTTDKVVMIMGGGYDNCYEDERYGATQTFSGSCVGSIVTNDGGLDNSNNPKTSSGTTAVTSLSNRKGNGLYVVEIAYIDSNGLPNFTSTGNKIWSSTSFDFSMVTEPTALDTNYDGYVDRLYVGDTGGNLWRADLSSTDKDNWNVTKIFSSNPGADSSNGRKIFYKPSAVVDVNNIVRIYFGTGDREHPLNRAVIDRMYEVIDKGQTSAITEAKLVDVTLDQMQAALTTAASNTIYNTSLALASDPTDTTTYGWYIRLDGGDRNPVVNYPGEKVLAPATVYNKVVYYTTYSPNTATVTNPCQVGNLGMALLYKLDYDKGTAVDNFDITNDSAYGTYNSNLFAVPQGKNYLLQRTDRREQMGTGIPSGIVVTGDKVFVGCGGGICTSNTTAGGQVFPLYWRQR